MHQNRHTQVTERGWPVKTSSNRTSSAKKTLSAEEVEANLEKEEAELEGDDCRETVDLLAESPSRVSHSLRQGLGFRV